MSVSEQQQYNCASPYLDLHQVRLLLAQVKLVDLGVSQDTDNLAVLHNALELLLHLLLASLGGQVLGILGEGFLLGGNPVLVEATAHSLAQVLSPHGGQGAETTGSLDVADDADNNHGGSLDDGDSLDDLLLVGLGARTVKVADNVGHAGLVAQEGSQVGSSGGVVLGEGFHLAAKLV